MTPLRSPPRVGNHPGKQIQDGVEVWGSTPIRSVYRLSRHLAHLLGTAGYTAFGALPMPKMAAHPLRPAPCCFPHASPVSQEGAGKQKTAARDRFKSLISLRKIGAGEGIRTLDPNLGKVPQGSTLGYPAPRHGLILSYKSMV